MAAREEQIPPVLRVSQLDAAELDVAILQHLKSQVSRSLQYFKPGILTRVEPEVNACLRLLLWKFTIHTASATVGQKLLNLRYSGHTSSRAGLSDRQKLLYALIVVVGKWLQDRSHDLAGWTGHASFFQTVFKLLSAAENCLKVVSVLNFLVFLQQGRYQSLLERALAIRPVYHRKQAIRQVSFEYMTRELLWHGFAEFLFFLLPLINIRRWKNVVTNQLLGSVGQESDVNLRGPVELKECAVCGEWPTNPHDIGCQHVFCFYCIKANQLADPGFCCPACSQPANQIRPVNSVPVTIMSS